MCYDDTIKTSNTASFPGDTGAKTVLFVLIAVNGTKCYQSPAENIADWMTALTGALL